MKERSALSLSVSLSLACLLVTTSPLRAQVPGCQPAFQIANALPGVDNANDAVAWDPDGAGPLPEHIVVCGYAGAPVAGYRGYAGNLEHWGVAVFNPATEQWSTLGNNPAPAGSIFARLGVDSNDRLYIATPDTIYRWQNGTWVTIGFSSFQYSRFSDLVAGDNGEMFVVGSFNNINGVTAYGAARFDGAQWHAMGAGVVGTPMGAFRRQNGNLFVYGAAGTYGGVTYNGLYEWDGSTWSVTSSPPFPAAIAATELANGDLVAGGNGTGLYRFDGTTWTSMGVGAGEPLGRLHTVRGGDLIVTGNFIQWAGMPARFIARWDGSTWSTLGNHPDTPKALRLANMNNGDLLVAGMFDTAGAAAAANVARWDGNAWSGLGDGINGDVWVLKRLANGDILAAGDFSGLACANGDRADRMARFDGQDWHAYGNGLDRLVRDVTELPNGDLVAVGDFLNSGNTPVSRIAYWNGSTWSPLGSGADGNLHAVTSLPNGDIVVGGYTFVIGGALVRHLARWDGSGWNAFGSGVTASVGAYGVDELVTMPNGDLVVGGRFDMVDGVSANGIARWDGNTWSAMAAGTNNNGLGPVHAMYLSPNDTLFAAATGQLWQWDGSTWTGLGINGGHGNSVECFATLPNGELITGSADNQIVVPPLPLPDSNLRRWPTGAGNATEFATFVPGSVRAMLLEDDGSVLIGGTFEGTFPTGVSSNYLPNGFLARLAPTCPATTTVIGTGCLGSAGPATLASTSSPWLGSEFTATASGMPTNSIAVAAYSSSTNMVPLGLPSTPGCLMVASPVLLEALPTIGGEANTSVTVPSAAALVGLQLTHQVVALNFLPSGLQAVSTNGLLLTTGAL